jgi:hypothetical protein
MNPELAALQSVIQDVHQLMATIKDPEGTAVVSQCLTALTRLQKTMMSPQGQGGATNPLIAALGGGQ